MEISIKTFFLLGSVILTGLSAGLFFAWSVSVIPGTQKLMDATYLESMQSINRAILNPLFYTVFFGPFLFPAVSSFFAYSTNKTAFALFLAAALIYAIGTIGVTALGNIPLNDQLDILNLTEMNSKQRSAFRTDYESKWNQFHSIRTAFSLLVFVLALLGVIEQL